VRPTGVALIDRALGGLWPGFPLVLAGPTGSGRTVLCLQLAEAACRQGEAVALLTGEPPRLLLRQAESMGLDLMPALRDGALVLLELDAQVAATARAHGGGALVEALREAAPEASLVLLDPLTALTAEIADEVAMRSLVRALFDAAAEAGQVVAVTVEQERLDRDALLDRVLKEACGAFLQLLRGEAGGLALEVAKSRLAGGGSGPLRFRIGAGGTAPLEPGGDHDGEETHPAAAATPAAALESARFHWSRELAEETPSAAAPTGRPEVGRATAPEPGAGTVAPGPEPENGEAPRRPRLLVVDEDRALREQLRSWMGERYELVFADDGFSAMTAFLARPPDLVLLDVVLPRIGGFEVLRALRAAGSRVPVLVVSRSLARAVDRVRALVLGASDTLPKPAQRFELGRKVEALLRAPAPPLPEIDPEEVEALLGGGASLRILEEGDFRERLERACRFGDEFGLPSALVGVEASRPASLDALVEAAERTLRAEDAVCRLSGRRALLLLVSTGTGMVPAILARLTPPGSGGDTDGDRLRWRAAPAQPAEGDKPWLPLFRGLTDWPAAREPEHGDGRTATRGAGPGGA